MAEVYPTIPSIPQIALATLQMRKALPIAPPGYINLNVTSMGRAVQHGINISEVSPYNLKDLDGRLFENIWQGSKLYPVVHPIRTVKYNTLYWEWGYEVHCIDGQVTPAYWNWRERVYGNPYPLRYPNGREHRHEALCALWYDGTGWVSYDYITSRKKIYCKYYSLLVKATTGYQQLQQLLQQGYAFQFCETDVRPAQQVTRELLISELNNPRAPFGHCYVLSACLLGHEDIWEDPIVVDTSMNATSSVT